jgi:hypothetical protein
MKIFVSVITFFKRQIRMIEDKADKLDKIGVKMHLTSNLLIMGKMGEETLQRDPGRY